MEQRKSKKLKLWTKSGLGISENGRILCPIVSYNHGNGYETAAVNTQYNHYGQPLAKEGDYITFPGMGIISKDNTGQIINGIAINKKGNVLCDINEKSIRGDGAIKLNISFTLTKEQYEEFMNLDLKEIKIYGKEYYKNLKEMKKNKIINNQPEMN
jgi:hypothetical protein